MLWANFDSAFGLWVQYGLGCGRSRQVLLQLGGMFVGGPAGLTLDMSGNEPMLVAIGHNMELGCGFHGLDSSRFVGLWLQEVLLTQLGWVEIF